MKQDYLSPKIEIVYFNAEDIVSTSGFTDGDWGKDDIF